MLLTLALARISVKLGVPESVMGKLVTTRPSNISYLDGPDLSGLDNSVGDPFHYPRPQNSSAADQEKQAGCQDEPARTAAKAPYVPQTGTARVRGRKSILTLLFFPGHFEWPPNEIDGKRSLHRPRPASVGDFRDHGVRLRKRRG